MARVKVCGLFGPLQPAGLQVFLEGRSCIFSARQISLHSASCAGEVVPQAKQGNSPEAAITSSAASSFTEGDLPDLELHCSTIRSEEEDAEGDAAWLSEAKSGGRLHLRERRRLFALTSSFADSTAAVAPPEQTPYSFGIPMLQHLPAAVRRRQQECSRGMLLRQQCMQAIVEFGTDFERSWVYRHINNPDEELTEKALGGVFRKAEIRGYLRFLVSHLPSLELQSLMSSFLSTNLNEMDEGQMLELLYLLQLGERRKRTATDLSAQKSLFKTVRGPCACAVGRCCWEQRMHRKKPKEVNSGSFCCERLTAVSLLQFLRCRGDLCVPPCIRGNTALRSLLSFVDREHPLLHFVPPPGGTPSR